MQLLALLHRWTGGIAGLLLAVIGLSGIFVVFYFLYPAPMVAAASAAANSLF